MDLQKLNNLIDDAELTLKNRYIKEQLFEFAQGVENLIYNNATLGKRDGIITISIPVKYRYINNLTTFIIDYLGHYCKNIYFMDKEVQLKEGFPSVIKVEYRIPRIEEVK